MKKKSYLDFRVLAFANIEYTYVCVCSHKVLTETEDGED